MIRFSLLLVAILLSPISASLTFAADLNPKLAIETTDSLNNVKIKTISLKEMKKKLAVKEFTMMNPEFQKSIRYRAFVLKDLLKTELEKDDFDEIVFICADGYRSPLPRAELDRLHLHLAYAEVSEKNKEGWATYDHGKEKINTGPFYALSSDANEYSKFNWPYQVVGLELVQFKKRYATILPKDIDVLPATASTKGFHTFRKQCIRCHTINLIGGSIAPELNSPQNVLEYLDHDYIRKFIKNPLAFRAKDKMPPFTNLSDDNISDIFAYFEEMSHRKLK